MIRHLLKLVWNRKRSTALVMLEIAVSFLVLVGVGAVALHFADNWRRPLGYEWRDVWAVEVDFGLASDDEWTAEQAAQVQRLLREAASLPRVKAAAAAHILPFEFSTANSDVGHGERSVMTLFNEASDDLDEVLGLRLVAGRWFDRRDDGQTHPPVVINRRLADELFADRDPLGELVERGDSKVRVVGVVDDFRQHGELTAPQSYTFHRVPPRYGGERPPRRLLLRMEPGTDGAYEREVLARLAPVAPAWSLEVAPLSQYRESRFRFALAPLLVATLVAAALLLMVALGLLGVLWQSVTRRTRELGLRRAAGASRAAIRRQLVGELLLVTTLGLLPALVLVAQLPLLGMLGPLDPRVFAAAVALAMVAIYALVAACGIYPGRVATRLEPAEALRWE